MLELFFFQYWNHQFWLFLGYFLSMFWISIWWYCYFACYSFSWHALHDGDGLVHWLVHDCWNGWYLCHFLKQILWEFDTVQRENTFFSFYLIFPGHTLLILLVFIDCISCKRSLFQIYISREISMMFFLWLNHLFPCSVLSLNFLPPQYVLILNVKSLSH